MRIHVLLFNAVLGMAAITNGHEIRNTSTQVNYDPGELLSKLLNRSIFPRQGGYGLIKFDDQPDLDDRDRRQHGLVSFEGQPAGQTQSVKFQDQDLHSHPGNSEDGVNDVRGDIQSPVTFQDDNRIEDPPVSTAPVGNAGQKKKRKRNRRRRPRQQRPSLGYQAYPGLGSYPTPAGPAYPAAGGPFFPGPPAGGPVYPMPGTPVYPGPGGPTYPAGAAYPGIAYPGLGHQGPYSLLGGPIPFVPQTPLNPNPAYPGYPGPYRPYRRPKPSIAADALTAVTGALSSIALYDDYQCVPRLLCEAAGGAPGAAAPAGLLQSAASLQPLLTLLAAYNGVSTSPLFVFGRAVFLGMTSRGAPGPCRYAYPQCPTDPEQLVHYLNNHNGGFFRFFGAPHLSNSQYGQQNLEQFFNQLSIPGQYGFQSNVGFPSGIGLPNQQVFPNYEQPGIPPQQNYGLYSNLLANQHNGAQQPSFYNQQNYGPNYPYSNRFGSNQVKYKSNEDCEDNKSNKMEKRIQNNKADDPVDNEFDSAEQNSKWKFPENNIVGHNILQNDNNTGAKDLRFPEDNSLQTNDQIQVFRKTRGFLFPGAQTNRNLYDYNNIYDTPAPQPIYSNAYNYDSNYNNGFQKYNVDEHGIYMNDEEGVETIYVVRGDGDPNNPEVIKLRPGQKFSL